MTSNFGRANSKSPLLCFRISLNDELERLAREDDDKKPDPRVGRGSNEKTPSTSDEEKV